MTQLLSGKARQEALDAIGALETDAERYAAYMALAGREAVALQAAVLRLKMAPAHRGEDAKKNG